VVYKKVFEFRFLFTRLGVLKYMHGMSRALHNYIETEAKVKDVLIQTKIDADMAEDFKAVCEKNGWKMTEAIRGLIRKTIDDYSGRVQKSA